jgi:hypothetical protein
MELYKTFTFALTPFMVMFLLGFALYAKPDLKIAELRNTVLITTLIIISSAILFIGLMTEWWVQHYYGKYAKEIKKVIDELKKNNKEPILAMGFLLLCPNLIYYENICNRNRNRCR